MKLSIVNPKGVIFEGETEYVVVEGNNGQLAILENHTLKAYNFTIQLKYNNFKVLQYLLLQNID